MGLGEGHCKKTQSKEKFKANFLCALLITSFPQAELPWSFLYK